jgi:hypothetical protein
VFALCAPFGTHDEFELVGTTVHEEAAHAPHFSPREVFQVVLGGLSMAKWSGERDGVLQPRCLSGFNPNKFFFFLT